MLWSAFILGLVGSLHCVGMCGPIAFMLPVSHHQPLKKGVQISLYHLGRILAYAIIGLVFGLVGQGFMAFGYQQHISIAVGILMIILVLIPQSYIKPLGVFRPFFRFINGIKSELGKALHKKSYDTFFSLGFLNGFLPCGLVYMAVVGAFATQGFSGSIMYMVLFGLGTVPMMTTVVYAQSFIKKHFKFNYKKLIPVAVIIVGLLFILRGMGLGIKYISPKLSPPTEQVEAAIQCH
ncbi:sulfite exporter TauE/SafE family protein [Mesohalobacter halotolerans]|uniref:Sulfite exporter TauE/SafE family protein n=1 Tax=Mesohalobacter halotolerans TaxID=1883405 RepID=A0A4U5TR11_9FLAO|nr:sulfite exporter TauE/SafE family protein [Mesohalobacter halotolerans]MBS3739244.1 sulfite exporter TauE/SafE family protein [Psychroflexus sp.]TKS56513.1 sulfite exporter TauE/SafE family protein [Mesohalobacter halotolerans]